MDTKIYDIPFRTPSLLSDFACKDGEIAEARNLALQSSSGEELPLPLLDFPPEPDISFSLKREVLHGWHIASDMYPSKTLSASSPGMEYWNSVAARLLSQFQSEALSQNLFVAPFYAIAAWKTIEGTYLSPTEPVFLIPNSEAPLIFTDGNPSSSELELKVAGALGGICCRFKTDERLRDWVGKIESLEILVSEPAHYYDTSNIFLPFNRISTESYGIFLDTSTGDAIKERICTQTLPLAWKAKSYVKTKPEELSYFPFASVPLAEVDLMTSWNSPDTIPDTGKRGSLKLTDIKMPYGKDKASEIVTVMGQDREISLSTRPIKLSGAGTFKKIHKVFLRGNFSPSKIHFSAYASRNMQKWWKISSANSSFLRSPDTYFRFYKFTITGFLASGETLEGMTLQN